MFIICQLTKERGKTWFNIGVTQWRFFVSMNSLWNIRPSLLLYIKTTIKMITINHQWYFSSLCCASFSPSHLALSDGIQAGDQRPISVELMIMLLGDAGDAQSSEDDNDDDDENDDDDDENDGSYKWGWRKTWRRPALILHLHLQVHLQCFNLLLPASLQSLSFGCRFPHLLSFRGPTSQELRAPKVLLEVCQVAFLLVLCSIFLHPLSSTSNSLQLRHVVT